MEPKPTKEFKQTLNIELNPEAISDEHVHVDITYIAEACSHDTITVLSKGFAHEARLLDGGKRSLSVSIPASEICTSQEIIVTSTIPVEIVSADVRQNYYDFFGLRTSDWYDEGSADRELEAAEIARTIDFFITWFVTFRCNYRCPYCWQEAAADGYRKHRIKEIAPQIWADAFKRLKPSEIYFTGGEPSLYKNLPDLIAALDPSIRLSMSSNLGSSFSLDRWIRNVDATRFSALYISFHPTQVGIDEFLHKLEVLVEARYQGLGVRMVLYPANLPNAQELLDRCRRLGVPVKFEPFVPPESNSVTFDHGFHEEVQVWINRAKEMCYELRSSTIPIYNHTDKPNYWESIRKDAFNEDVSEKPSFASVDRDFAREPIFCSAGWRSLNIDVAGNAYVCMSALDRSKLFGSSGLPHYSPIGNILDKDFRLLDKPLICWESFRCSGCDFKRLDRAWKPVFLVPRGLPLPE